MKLVKVVLLLAFIASPMVVAEPVSKATEALYERLAKIESLTARFVQTVKDHEGWTVSEQRGELALQRPNKLHWHCTEPQEQEVVADGEKLWLFDPDLEQVTIYNNAQMFEGPMTLLAQSKEELAKQFAVATEECSSSACFILVPRATDQDTAFAELRFDFDGEQLSRILMLDRMRQSTETRLSNAQINTSIAKERFSFNVPEGVDVVIND